MMAYHYFKVKYGKEHIRRVIFYNHELNQKLNSGNIFVKGYRRVKKGSYTRKIVNLDKVQSIERKDKLSKEEYKQLESQITVEEG